MTPWGESSELGARKLRPEPGTSRAQVEQNQKERLHGAMVAVAASKGYGATTVSNLMEVAGVSRTTFYRYFTDKKACFLATLELILAGILAATDASLEGEEPVRVRAEAGLATFMGLLATQPDAARLCVIEAEAVGPKAVAMVDRTAARFAQIIGEVFDGLPDQRGMPRGLIEAMVAGVRKLMQSRLLRRSEAELAKLVPDLVRLGLAYRPPPHPLPDRAPRNRTPAPVERYRSVDEPAQKLELAAMAVIARDGYVDSRMSDIATEAQVSAATLYATFTDKADLFGAAMLRSRLRMASATIPAYRRAADWAEGIAALVRSSLAFLEAEPDYARLITIDVNGAGNEALESRERSLEATRHLLDVGLDRSAVASPIASEAIQSVLYGMLAARIRSRHRNLVGMASQAIYMVLAPVLGPEEAYRHATTLPGREARAE